MKPSNSNGVILAATVASLVVLSACSKTDESAGEPSETRAEHTKTLAESLAEMPDLSQFGTALETAQLGSIFDGPGSYTLLAPTNAAFTAIADEATVLMTEEQRPVLVAVVREHVLPGHLTTGNISQAIDSKGGPVTVTTLGGTDVTFSRIGDVITVDNGAGSTATIAGPEAIASNGTIIPLDAILIPEEQPDA